MPRALPARRPARQSRSRRAEQTILSTARRLLISRGFQGVSVADLARQAGTSVGGVYARFRDKGAILEVLETEVLDEMLLAFEAAMAPLDSPRATPARIVEAYVRVMVEQFRRHRDLIVEIRRHAGADRGSDVAARVAAFNARVHGRVRGLLVAHRRMIRHPDPTTAINFGLFLASAGAREAVLAGSLRSYPLALDDESLIRELRDAWLGVLGLPRGRKG